MRIKTIVFSSLLVLGCAFSLAYTAFAASNEAEITKDGVTLSGYVSGVNWPSPLADRIYYNAAIWGNLEYIMPPTATSVGDNFRVYVQPSSDKKTLSKVYLYPGKTMVSHSDKDYGDACGTGATRMELYMWNQESTKTISYTL